MRQAGTRGFRSSSLATLSARNPAVCPMERVRESSGSNRTPSLSSATPMIVETVPGTPGLPASGRPTRRGTCPSRPRSTPLRQSSSAIERRAKNRSLNRTFPWKIGATAPTIGSPLLSRYEVSSNLAIPARSAAQVERAFRPAEQTIPLATMYTGPSRGTQRLQSADSLPPLIQFRVRLEMACPTLAVRCAAALQRGSRAVPRAFAPQGPSHATRPGLGASLVRQ